MKKDYNTSDLLYTIYISLCNSNFTANNFSKEVVFNEEEIERYKSKKCIALASRGWETASQKALKGNHAQHIHANCDCTYAIRFDGESKYESYNPDKYKEIYDNASDGNSYEKINAIRREQYKLNKDEINASKRINYESLKSRNVPMTAEQQKVYLKQFLNDKNQTGTSKPVTIGGMDVTVTKAQFGFGNGLGGIKKTVDAVIYETQDGTKFVFPKSYKKALQQMTPEHALSLWSQVPSDIRRQAQKTIQFVDYYNPQDSYWRKIYKDFKHSYATGGQSITFYRYDYPHDDAYVIRTYCHETGHFIDTNLGTNGRFSDENLWTKAMSDDIVISGRKSCTAYGENSAAEDFAESMAEYVKDKTGFEKAFPGRAAILATIISI
jgi:hypothetical protein